MVYRTLVGEKKALVFPVMCYGYLTIDYDREIADRDTADTTDDIPYGIFGHDDSFTIATILTPYDVNGSGYWVENANNPAGNAGITTSKKTMPSQQLKSYTVGGTTIAGSAASANTNLQSHNYLSSWTTNERKDHEMMIFYNTNVQLSLINTTSLVADGVITNQPAEYKVRLTVVADSVSDSLTSDAVILSDSQYVSVAGTVNTSEGYDTDEPLVKYELVATVTGGSGVVPQTDASDESATFVLGESLYIRSSQTFTKVATVTTNPAHVSSVAVTIVYEAGKSFSDITGQALFREGKREATYLVSPFHIAATFDVVSGEMIIYLDGKSIATKIHSQAPIASFSFTRENCYIGAKVTTTDTDSDGFLDMDDADNRKQFMGELHEFAISDGLWNSFLTVDTLLPQYRTTLLYYRFEEVDL
jgi:hypothetical protein